MLGDGKCCEHQNTGEEPEFGKGHDYTCECEFLALYGPEMESDGRAEQEVRSPVSQVVPGTSEGWPAEHWRAVC